VTIMGYPTLHMYKPLRTADRYTFVIAPSAQRSA